MSSALDDLRSEWIVTTEYSGTAWKITKPGKYALFSPGISGILGNGGMMPVINGYIQLGGTFIETKRATYKKFEMYYTAPNGQRVPKYTETKYIYVEGADPTNMIFKLSGWTVLNESVFTLSTTTTDENSPEPEEDTTQDIAEARGYLYDTGIFYNEDGSVRIEHVEDSEYAKLKNVVGVFGLPYQFLPQTDTRIDNFTDEDDSMGSIGYEYANKIVEKIPLLFISPGKASYLNGFSSEERETMLGGLIDAAEDAVSDIINGEGSAGRYYTFEYDVARYYKFVNPMCRIAARYLELQDFKLDDTPLDEVNWMSYIGSHVKSITDVIDQFLAIPFYMDAETSVSESYSNTTTSSMLASTVNGLSDTARELNFLLGYSQSALNVDIIKNDVEIRENVESVTEWVKKNLGGGNFFQRFAKTVGTVATGGRMIFPEIWSESSFSRSYNCEFKFVSPDPSTLSVYLNTLVPLFHLIGLVAPQSLSDDPNTYVNPFLVRAIYKGHFNVDTGIITDMSITRGDECQWTIEGIPTSIKVSMTIKDLYPVMSITQTGGIDGLNFDTLDNTAQMDYIANLCGINMYKPEISRIADMWLTNNLTNRISDIARINIWGNIQNKLQNSIMGIFRN